MPGRFRRRLKQRKCKQLLKGQNNMLKRKVIKIVKYMNVIRLNQTDLINLIKRKATSHTSFLFVLFKQ